MDMENPASPLELASSYLGRTYSKSFHFKTGAELSRILMLNTNRRRHTWEIQQLF